MAARSGALTLAEAIFPAPSVRPDLRRYSRAWSEDLARVIAREGILLLGFAGFVAICAQIAVRLPWTTVPITGQTFAVLVTGGVLGARRGAGSLSVYMIMGMIGIPVFAPGSGVTEGSWDIHLLFPWSGNYGLPWDISSGGYIVGFIFAAALVGFLAERQWDRKPWVHLGLFLGNVVLYIPGILWLAYLLATDWIHPAAGKPLGDLIVGSGTWDKAFKGGLYPFVVGDMMKLLLASLVLPSAWAMVNLRRGNNWK